MSKKLKGIYGTFNSKKLHDAVIDTCVKKGCTIKSFLKNTYKDHDYGWYQHVKKRNYGEMHDIQKLCSLVDCSFDSLDFIAGPRCQRLFPVNLNNEKPVDVSETMKEALSSGDFFNLMLNELQQNSHINRISFSCGGVKCSLEKE